MYRIAYSKNENTIIYFDDGKNKHIRKGGNLSWRINRSFCFREFYEATHKSLYKTNKKN